MKKINLVLLVVVLIVTLSGCAKKNTEEIQFMTWGSSTEMGIIKPIVDEYNKTHDIKVKLMHVPQNYFQKLHILFASGLAPDVIFINNLYMPIYQKAGLLEDLTDLINKNDYYKNALSTLSVNDKIYAIPRDVSNMVIFYNKDLLNKSDVKISDNWNTKDFFTISKKLKKNNKYGFCMEFEPGYWENFVSTENKPIFLNEKITLKEEESINTIQNIADLINKESLSPNKEQLAITPCAQLFLQQKTPFFISGRWSVPKIEAEKTFEYDVASFPSGGSKYYIPLNASGWAISKNSKHKDAAIDFVKYLSSDENIEKITESGLITPAKKKVANSHSFKNGKVYIDIIEKSTPNIVPSDYNVKIDKIKTASKSVLGGYQSAKQAFDNI